MSGSNLYILPTDHGIFGKFVYNYTKQVGKCIDDKDSMEGSFQQDWVTVEFCQESCDNDLNCYAFQIGYKSCYLFPERHWRGDLKTYTTKLRTPPGA